MIEIIGLIASVLAFVGSGYSAHQWWKAKQREAVLDQPVSIFLVDHSSGTEVYQLPYRPTRREINRSEVLGFLGMVPSRGQRFDIASLNSPDYFEQLRAVREGRADHLSILITANELQVFELEPVVENP